MRAPDFWSNPPDQPGWQAWLLAPATWLWRLGIWWRGRGIVPYRVPVAVICIGNLTAGGAGKTPMVAALLERLIAGGRCPHVVSRGYGGGLVGPHRVDPNCDNHRQVGDEPLLLAAFAPVWVAKDRAAGVKAAVTAGAELILLDDGFQNPSVAVDSTILMVDAGVGFGNGRLIPAGPLREPVAPGLARADVVVLVGTDAECNAALVLWPCLAGAVTARMVPRETGLSLIGERVVAFAGIDRPSKFFATLTAMGAEIVEAVPFADHCEYPLAVLRRLQRHALAENAMLVTTEKDAARLPADFRPEVVVVQIHLIPGNWALIDQVIAQTKVELPHSRPR
ncbi:MAG TPA: tetraacyldisaccharide 4'-kinase [Thermohalobaculum sp.]|nr:tetraacyldisaccharide 4'-kinase [Thermohalobaculum sp.]